MLSLPLLDKLTEVQDVQSVCAFNEGFEHLFRIMEQDVSLFNIIVFDVMYVYPTFNCWLCRTPMML